ncbi:MAG: hypothetical protein KKB12_02430, partial [Candidatus Omnitrophica bacterium]|nr:hypothetical protein [Candidatus Omnitrophota bacterium]
MVLLAKLVAIAFIIIGCIVIMKRGVVKTILEYVKVGNRIYGVAALRILFGIIFILAAVMARSGWIVTVIGWLLIVAGVFVFVIKKEKAFEIIDKMVTNAKPKTIRLIGTIPVVIGVLLIS